MLTGFSTQCSRPQAGRTGPRIRHPGSSLPDSGLLQQPHTSGQLTDGQLSACLPLQVNKMPILVEAGFQFPFKPLNIPEADCSGGTGWHSGPLTLVLLNPFDLDNAVSL